MSLPDSGLLSNRPLLRRALVPVAALVFVIVGSIVGFMSLAGVGLIEATYWLLNPENVGVHFQRTTGPEQATKAFAVVSRVSLIVASLWLGQTVVAALFGGQIKEELKRVTQEQRISNLSDHVVVCGYGMFGETIARRLDALGEAVVVIEQTEQKVKAAQEDGLLVIDGDARLEGVLERARVAEADTVVGAIDDSNVNIQISILVDQLAPDARLIVRVGDQQYASTARRAGADIVVIPEIMSGGDIVDNLRS